MRRKELSEDSLNEVKEMIKEINESHIPVIVEGNRDINALRGLGITGEIIKINSGKPILTLCEEISSKYGEVILLLDWDKKGYELTKRIRKILESLGTRCITNYRKKLSEIFPYASSVEEISL